MPNMLARVMLCALMICNSSLYAGTWISFQPTVTETKRLDLDTAYAVDKLGSVGPNQLYNRTAGYSIPGLPRGDTILGLSATGHESPQPAMTMFDRGDRLSIDGESKLYCNAWGNELVSPAFSVFQPIAVGSKQPVISTDINMTIGVNKGSMTRLRIARNHASVAAGFYSTLNDHLLLEISDGTIWAWPTATGYTNNVAERRRIGSFNAYSKSSADLYAQQLTIALGEHGENCSIESGHPQFESWLTRPTILPSAYCNNLYQNELVVALEVDRATPFGPPAIACLSSMEVVSQTRR